MCLSRRIPRFIVVFSSGHRWLLFVASLWAYVLVVSFYVFVSSGLPFVNCATYLNRYLIYRDIYFTDFTCIIYTFPFLLGTLLLCYLVTLLPCYPITLVPWYPVTLLPYYFVTLLPCYLVTLLPLNPVTLLLCYLVTLLPCYPVTLLLC